MDAQATAPATHGERQKRTARSIAVWFGLTLAALCALAACLWPSWEKVLRLVGAPTRAASFGDAELRVWIGPIEAGASQSAVTIRAIAAAPSTGIPVNWLEIVVFDDRNGNGAIDDGELITGSHLPKNAGEQSLELGPLRFGWPAATSRPTVVINATNVLGGEASILESLQ